jgi:hypothetical protein
MLLKTMKDFQDNLEEVAYTLQDIKIWTFGDVYRI